MRAQILGRLASAVAGGDARGEAQLRTNEDVTRSLAAIHPDGGSYLTLPRDSDGVTLFLCGG